jgi:hypothetical protein
MQILLPLSSNYSIANLPGYIPFYWFLHLWGGYGSVLWPFKEGGCFIVCHIEIYFALWTLYMNWNFELSLFNFFYSSKDEFSNGGLFLLQCWVICTTTSVWFLDISNPGSCIVVSVSSFQRPFWQECNAMIECGMGSDKFLHKLVWFRMLRWGCFFSLSIFFDSHIWLYQLMTTMAKKETLWSLTPWSNLKRFFMNFYFKFENVFIYLIDFY